MELAIQGVLIGVIATIGMDIWAAIVKFLFRLPTADWAMVATYSRSPLDFPPAPEGNWMEWVASITTGKPKLFMMGKPRMSTTMLL